MIRTPALEVRFFGNTQNIPANMTKETRSRFLVACFLHLHASSARQLRPLGGSALQSYRSP
ncbi:MAG: hypothetical protein EAZ24_14440 [Burkholderiales bacterium]|nr:MAG: hypothetical protein EAZ24_14440 [Burkholderiales bacterium]TAG79338.1 MAG: hypothetical protein EAZ21_10755 [Betaproteobacteria bacterium]